jgi:hypothetical protein
MNFGSWRCSVRPADKFPSRIEPPIEARRNVTVGIGSGRGIDHINELVCIE